MGGVDRGDQLRGYYSCKFYKYTCDFLLDVTITNAYIYILHHNHSPSLSVKEFRLQLSKELLAAFSSPRNYLPPSALQGTTCRLQHSKELLAAFSTPRNYLPPSALQGTTCRLHSLNYPHYLYLFMPKHRGLIS